MTQNNAKIVAITGGIGSGKSTVLNILKQNGAICLSADEINAELLLTPEYIKKITDAFPFVVEDGQINKRKLSAAVFNEKDELIKLNAIARPELEKLIRNKIIKAKSEGKSVFVECPLLYEWKIDGDFDYIILVTADSELRTERVIMRDKRDKNEIAAIMKNQISDKKKFDEKTIIITNDTTLDNLKEKVEKVYKQLTASE